LDIALPNRPPLQPPTITPLIVVPQRRRTAATLALKRFFIAYLPVIPAAHDHFEEPLLDVDDALSPF
jgi:hypothetical protein